jgi:hypothetical protein
MPYSLVHHCLSQNGAVTPESWPGQKALALFLQGLIQTQDLAHVTRLQERRSHKRPGDWGLRRAL